MSTNQNLLHILTKALDNLDPKEIWTAPSEEEFEVALDSILECEMSLKEALDLGESYPVTESFESSQLISTSDLYRMTGHGDLIGSEQYASIDVDVADLLLEYAPSSSIWVEDVLAHFSIEDQTQFDEIKNKRRSQRQNNS